MRFGVSNMQKFCVVGHLLLFLTRNFHRQSTSPKKAGSRFFKLQPQTACAPIHNLKTCFHAR